MILGVSRQRRLLIAGGEYSRRLLLNSWIGIHYLVQVRPLVLESDPALVGFRSPSTGEIISRLPHPIRVETVEHSAVPIASVVVNGVPQPILGIPFYTREWTYAGGLNPLGIKMNFLPRHRLQPVFTSGAGFLVSPRDIPVDHSTSFNFSFEAGLGFEWFLTAKRSLRLDYKIHHISNAFIGTNNPGIDSGFFQATYSFGR